MEERAVPATIAVTSLADDGPGTLRAAIVQANQNPAPDRIIFAPRVRGTITLNTALPDLENTLTIAGPGASALTVARSRDTQTPMFRIFTVPEEADVHLSGLTMTGGRDYYYGGGISNGGTLWVTASTITDNWGRGMSNSGKMWVTASTISNNWGGGISNGGTLWVTASTISGNSTSGGGGIYNYGVLTVTASTISGNKAYGGYRFSGVGGGIYNSKVANISISTISGNSADSGGGIYNGGDLTLNASTLSDNMAYSGAGLYVVRRWWWDTNETPLNVTVKSSIFANTRGSNLAGEVSTSLTSLGHNLFTDTPNVSLHPTDLVNTDPRLGPLADNGGPTFTHVLLPGSPAIDAGTAVPGTRTDQRGVPRPMGRAPDIGAFEVSHRDRHLAIGRRASIVGRRASI